MSDKIIEQIKSRLTQKHGETAKKVMNFNLTSPSPISMHPKNDLTVPKESSPEPEKRQLTPKWDQYAIHDQYLYWK